MTHYDITIGNYVARDVHYEIIMGHSIVVGTYHDVTMHTDVAMTFRPMKYPYTKTIHLDIQTRIHEQQMITAKP